MRSCFTFLRRHLCNPYPNSMRPTPLSSHFPSYSGNAHDPAIRSWNKRITRLIRSGRLDEARLVFDAMPKRDSVSWNTMMTGYVKRREIAEARELFDEIPERDRDVVSWNLMISGYLSCRGPGLGSGYVEEARNLFIRMPERDSISWNTMISGYARIGRMYDALCLFNSMPEQSVVSWNAMITGFLQNGDVDSAIEWFRKMPERDAASLCALISGLVQNGELDRAARILFEHGKEVDDGRKEDMVCAYNTLIAGYGQQGRVNEARGIFDLLVPFAEDRGDGGKGKFERNVISWNAMIMSYVKAGDIVSARTLFDEMTERDSFSWNTLISGYVQASDMEKACYLFCHMPNPDTFSWNSVIHGYAQMANWELALDFFHRSPQKNSVSWNSMIAGYEKHGKYEEAIKLFVQMQSKGLKSDRHTLSSVLGACAGLVSLDLGMQVHQLVTKTVIPDVPINNALVTMYSRCGALNEAMAIFDEVKLHGNVISWNAMIGGCASHGHGEEALELFEAMKMYRVQPTHITFISVLNACAHAGLVEQGRRYFNSMVSDFGIEPRTEHFSALVDILGRRGELNEALDLIHTMPQKPNKAVWGALLSACRMHNNMDLARVAADALMMLEPESSAPYVMLHNMYVDAQQWENAAQVRGLLERNNIRKECASSWANRLSC